ncbi:MAG: zinc ribbon domain-containing protein [Eubacterium sp.]|nr:zinc ribbon domain-containing protein [Eubacterium sp.]
MFCNMCGTNVPDNADFCPNCGADLRAFKQETPSESAAAVPEAAPVEPQLSSAETSPMMDIPIAEAPDDAEADTTVLTADMSGPLTMEDVPQTEGFSSVQEPEVRQHQPQVPEGKVVTPAPVTGSSILSDESVAPVGPAPMPTPEPGPAPEPVPAPAPQAAAPAPAPAPQPAPQQNPYQANAYGQPQPGQQGVTVINQMAPAGVPEEFTPISPWGYVGYSLLFTCIPLVSIILLFVFAFGATKNINVKNFAKSYLLIYLITIIIWIVILIISAITGAAILSGLD